VGGFGGKKRIKATRHNHNHPLDMIIDSCAGLHRPQTVLSLQNGHYL
jgi:hypothetical protein